MDMKTPRRLIPWVVTFIVFSMVLSCSVEQDVSLDREGAGTADITIALKPVLIRYFTDLLEFAGEEEAPIFDVYAIRQAFSSIPELELRNVEIPSRGTLHLEIAFSDIEQAFFRQIGTDVPSAVTLSPVQSGWKTGLYLDLENYKKILSRMLVLTGMITFEDYLTGLLEPGPEDVIVDMYEYAFEDYLQGESVKEILQDSAMVLSCTGPREVLGARGGEIEGKTITYSIPLLDILTLDKPMYYHFIYY